MASLRNCVECGAETDNLSLICSTCAPQYADNDNRRPEPPLVGDECDCEDHEGTDIA